MFDSRASLPKEVKADIEQFLNNARGTNCAWSQARILPVYIRRNIKLAEAPGYGKTIFEYEQNCHGAEDYKKVAEFIHTQLRPSQQPNTQTANDENADLPSATTNSFSQPDSQTPQPQITAGQNRPQPQ